MRIIIGLLGIGFLLLHENKWIGILIWVNGEFLCNALETIAEAKCRQNTQDEYPKEQDEYRESELISSSNIESSAYSS